VIYESGEVVRKKNKTEDVKTNWGVGGGRVTYMNS